MYGAGRQAPGHMGKTFATRTTQGTGTSSLVTKVTTNLTEEIK